MCSLVRYNLSEIAPRLASSPDGCSVADAKDELLVAIRNVALANEFGLLQDFTKICHTFFSRCNWWGYISFYLLP